MTKLILIFILGLISFSLLGQTLELEKEYLNNAITSGELTQAQAKEIGEAWNNLLKDFGEYPDLPFNPKTERVEFIMIDEFQGISKKDIFNRVKEWIAINYGSLSDVVHYEDYETGKIIVKGWTWIPVLDWFSSVWGVPKDYLRSAKCHYTTVYTIKDGKMKTEYTNITFGSKGMSYDVEQSISELYPVTLADKSTWRSRLSTLKNTALTIQLNNLSLTNFILLTQDDKNF